MHARPFALVPLAVKGPLDLGGQLQQQTVVGLARLGLYAQGQAVGLCGHGQRNARNAAQVGQGGVGKVLPQVVKPVVHRGVVAQRQVFGGAHQGRGLGGDGRQDDVPGLKELAKPA